MRALPELQSYRVHRSSTRLFFPLCAGVMSSRAPVRRNDSDAAPDDLSISELQIEHRISKVGGRDGIAEEELDEEEMVREETSEEYWRRVDEDAADDIHHRQYATGACICCVTSHSTPTRVVIPCVVL